MQLKDGGIVDYFKSGWNYIDLVPPVGIISLVIQLSVSNESEPQIGAAILKSVTTFFMWLKFLYFFRFFENTGYLIRIIVEMVYEMRSFAFVLLVSVFALGDTFMRIAEISDPEEEGNLPQSGFWSSVAYSYEMTIGDFDTGSFGSRAYIFVYVLFLINTLFNTIVMLNLLISIMMEAYGRI